MEYRGNLDLNSFAAALPASVGGDNNHKSCRLSDERLGSLPAVPKPWPSSPWAEGCAIRGAV